MAYARVSIDALSKVKSALNDYQHDISGLSAKIDKQKSEIVSSTEFEMQKIAKEIENTNNIINNLKKKIEHLTAEIDQLTNQINKLSLKFDLIKRIKLLFEEKNIEKLLEIGENTRENDIKSLIDFLTNPFIEKNDKELHLEKTVRYFEDCISQLKEKKYKAESNKSNAEDELSKAQGLLTRLQNKQDRMKTALLKMNDDLNILQSASKSFQSRAESQTEQNIGSIDRCISAIEEYLNG